MKKKLLAAVGLTAASLVFAACGGDDDDTDAAERTPTQTPAEETGAIDVWLMPEAEAWEESQQLVTQATALFQETYPNVEVNVSYGPWDTAQQRLDAAFAGNNPPDVVELGNTWVLGYAADGALADLTSFKTDIENSATWLQSLEAAGTYEGNLYGVPYYAGSRAVIYRKDMFEQAGITSIPTSMDEFKEAAGALNEEFGTDPNFSAFFLPGQYWYLATTLIEDQGGHIAADDGGTWDGTLDSPEAIAGLELYKELALTYSKADPTGNEATQFETFAEGAVGMMYSNGWEWGVVEGANPALAEQLGAFPLPSTSSGENAPAFLGGSNLSVPEKSDAKDLAVAWINAYTGAQVQTVLAEDLGTIPNSTTLTGLLGTNERVGPFATAAERSWFTPTTPGWAQVESEQVLQNMLVSIVTEEMSVEDAAAAASERITDLLGG